MGLYDDAMAVAHRHFVGRQEEVARFRLLLGGSEPRVWWVFGPGGIGKSRLLSVLAEEATGAGCRVVTVDLRSIDASTRALAGAVLERIDTDQPERVVVVLDSFDSAGPIERWLRVELLPALPSQTLVLIGSRRVPSLELRSDPTWSALLELIPLRGLSSDDGHRLLTLAGVPSDLAPKAMELGHGHPLALQLLAETLLNHPGGVVPEAINEAPDVVAAMLGRLIDEVPDDQHRLAIELVSLSRMTTRSMIRELCDQAGAEQLYEWLAAQPWIDRLSEGLCPHDLAREVIEADLYNNDPDRYASAKRALRNHILDPVRLQEDPDRCAENYLYLHRRRSVLRAAWDWSSFGQTEATGVRVGDRDALAELVAASYGPATVAVLDHWLERQPHGFIVLRSLGDVIGFITMLVFDEPTSDDLAADPSVAAIWRRAQRRGPPRLGETVGLFRFVCDAEAGTLPPSPTYNAVTILAVRYWLTMEGLSLDYVVKPREGSFEPMMHYVDFHPVDDAVHTVGDVEMVVFEHDWRVVPLEPWLDRMVKLESGAPIEPATDRTPMLVSLDESAFGEAVRSALRDLSQPARLADNPLLASRVVREGPRGDGPDRLAETIREGFAALDEHPRTERARRAVERTYLHGAVTQEAAAEVLGMAFSTYRRHLARGIDLLVHRLWQWELYGRSSAG